MHLAQYSPFFSIYSTFFWCFHLIYQFRHYKIRVLPDCKFPTRRVEQCLAQQLLGGVENGAAADFLLDAPQDVLSLARRCGTAANAAQGGVRGGGEADAPEQNAAAPAPDTVQACNL